MLPLMALPLLMGATSTGVTVATDLAFGVYHATQGKWGDMDDAAAGLIGSKNDSFVACCSEALVHGLITHSPLTAIPRAIYNGVRGIGEFIQGDYIDALVHCSSVVTSNRTAKTIAKCLSKEKFDIAKSLTKKSLRNAAEKSGQVAGGLVKDYVDPFVSFFKNAKAPAAPIVPGYSQHIVGLGIG